MSAPIAGPWKKSFKTKATNNLGIYDESGSLIASIQVHQLASEDVVSKYNATARLMSAAPDLMEALQACLKKGSKWHTCDPVVTQARAAIAKATGEDE